MDLILPLYKELLDSFKYQKSKINSYFDSLLSSLNNEAFLINKNYTSDISSLKKNYENKIKKLELMKVDLDNQTLKLIEELSDKFEIKKSYLISHTNDNLNPYLETMNLINNEIKDNNLKIKSNYKKEIDSLNNEFVNLQNSFKVSSINIISDFTNIELKNKLYSKIELLISKIDSFITSINKIDDLYNYKNNSSSINLINDEIDSILKDILNFKKIYSLFESIVNFNSSFKLKYKNELLVDYYNKVNDLYNNEIEKLNIIVSNLSPKSNTYIKAIKEIYDQRLNELSNYFLKSSSTYKSFSNSVDELSKQISKFDNISLIDIDGIKNNINEINKGLNNVKKTLSFTNLKNINLLKVQLSDAKKKIELINTDKTVQQLNNLKSYLITTNSLYNEIFNIYNNLIDIQNKLFEETNKLNIALYYNSNFINKELLNLEIKIDELEVNNELWTRQQKCASNIVILNKDLEIDINIEKEKIENRIKFLYKKKELDKERIDSMIKYHEYEYKLRLLERNNKYKVDSLNINDSIYLNKLIKDSIIKEIDLKNKLNSEVINAEEKIDKIPTSLKNEIKSIDKEINKLDLSLETNKTNISNKYGVLFNDIDKKIEKLNKSHEKDDNFELKFYNHEIERLDKENNNKIEFYNKHEYYVEKLTNQFNKSIDNYLYRNNEIYATDLLAFIIRSHENIINDAESYIKVTSKINFNKYLSGINNSIASSSLKEYLNIIKNDVKNDLTNLFINALNKDKPLTEAELDKEKAIFKTTYNKNTKLNLIKYNKDLNELNNELNKLKLQEEIEQNENLSKYNEFKDNLVIKKKDIEDKYNDMLSTLKEEKNNSIYLINHLDIIKDNEIESKIVNYECVINDCKSSDNKEYNKLLKEINNKVNHISNSMKYKNHKLNKAQFDLDDKEKDINTKYLKESKTFFKDYLSKIHKKIDSETEIVKDRKEYKDKTL